MSELKPCPFCGSKASYDHAEGILVSCTKHLCPANDFGTGVIDEEWNTRASPWVSVEDRLPEEGQRVLVSWKAGSFQCAELAWIEYQEAESESLIGDPRWFDDDSFGSPWPASPEFWMPIPELPEVQP